LPIAALGFFLGIRHATDNRSLVLAAGLLSVGFGLLLTYQIGFVDRLFMGG
jgi:hypothetical protein